MTAEDIVRVATEMKCMPTENALKFARMIAEQCAQLAHECGETASAADAAAFIRTEFRLAVQEAKV